MTLAACAGVAPTSPSATPAAAQELVTQRANARWKHMLIRDFEKAYAFAAPGFRALVSAEAYRARFGSAVIWLDAEVVRVSCPEPTKCEALIRLEFRSTVGKREDKTSTHIDEIWLLEEGQWWKYENLKGN